MELTKKKFSFRRNIDMTQGSIALNILRFAFPLLLGNLFQQLYSMVDTWVIGQTGNDGAYAAVGSVGPVINVLIGFFLGLSSGAGVIISQYYGAKNEKRVNEVVHTAMALTAIRTATTSRTQGNSHTEPIHPRLTLIRTDCRTAMKRDAYLSPMPYLG